MDYSFSLLKVSEIKDGVYGFRHKLNLVPRIASIILYRRLLVLSDYILAVLSQIIKKWNKGKVHVITV